MSFHLNSLRPPRDLILQSGPEPAIAGVNGMSHDGFSQCWMRPTPCSVGSCSLGLTASTAPSHKFSSASKDTGSRSEITAAKSENPNFLITPFCSLKLHVYLRTGNEVERRIYHFIKREEQKKKKKSICVKVYKEAFLLAVIMI